MAKKTFLTLILLVSVFILQAQMSLEYNTNLSAGTTITLPLYGTVDVIVDWGDGNTEAFASTGNKTHTYTVGGIYIVGISGTLTHFGSISNTNLKLTKIIDFGNIGLTDLSYACNYAINLTQVPTQIPNEVTNLRGMFLNANSFNQDIANWDVSNVSDISFLFKSASSFNQDIGNWDVSNVTDMSGMFNQATSFNQNIGSWDVSSVTDMNNMFSYTNLFNQDLGNWNVTNVTDMSYMFCLATSFNQDIGNWNVGSVANMNNIFIGVTLSVANYDSLLIGWAAQNLMPDVNFSGGYSKYSCEAIGAHDILTGNPNNWNVFDGGLLDDDILPTISCPSNFIVIADNISQTYSVQGTELDPLEFTDNCSVSSVINDFSSTESLNGSVFHLGTTTVVWTVEDEVGNQTTCSLDVTVETFVGIESSIGLFSIYPNPTSGIVNIEADNLQNYSSVIVTDALGRVITELKIDSNNMSIDFGEKNSGLYFIEIRGKQNSVFEKIVVE